MCNRVSQRTRKLDEVGEHLKLKVAPGAAVKYQPGYALNAYNRPYLPVIRKIDGEPFLDVFRWRLIPGHIHDLKAFSKYDTHNFKGESLFESKLYRPFWKDRCIVIATGFFEPRDRFLAGRLGDAAPGIQKSESWYITPALGEYFFFAGLYTNNTVSIGTVHANPLMERVHNDGQRMPVILDYRKQRRDWLSDITDKEVKEILSFQIDSSRLIAYRTMDGIFNNRVDADVPEANMPHEDGDESVYPGFFDDLLYDRTVIEENDNPASYYWHAMAIQLVESNRELLASTPDLGRFSISFEGSTPEISYYGDIGPHMVSNRTLYEMLIEQIHRVNPSAFIPHAEYSPPIAHPVF